MHSRATRQQALALVASGRSLRSVAAELGLSRAAVREWCTDPTAALRERGGDSCWACAGRRCEHPATYAYLLGQYLGDGYLVTSSRVPKLRIACADTYPGIAEEVDAAMALLSGNRPGAVQSIGCSDRYSYWNHWPCLFPQHGPARKHERAIVLTDWQEAIVDVEPWSLTAVSSTPTAAGR